MTDELTHMLVQEKKRGTMKISRSTYLQALGLFSLARKHQLKVVEFSKELDSLLNIENGHVSDAVYDEAKGFDEALKRDGIEVEENES